MTSFSQNFLDAKNILIQASESCIGKRKDKAVFNRVPMFLNNFYSIRILFLKN